MPDYKEPSMGQNQNYNPSLMELADFSFYSILIDFPGIFSYSSIEQF